MWTGIPFIPPSSQEEGFCVDQPDIYSVPKYAGALLVLTSILDGTCVRGGENVMIVLYPR